MRFKTLITEVYLAACYAGWFGFLPALEQYVPRWREIAAAAVGA